MTNTRWGSLGGEEEEEGKWEGKLGEGISVQGGEGDAEGILHDSIFCQVAELHVAKGFPGANHCDVCAETLHAGNVVSEPEENKS